jgi:hypothetical protein
MAVEREIDRDIEFSCVCCFGCFIFFAKNRYVLDGLKWNFYFLFQYPTRKITLFFRAAQIISDFFFVFISVSRFTSHHNRSKFSFSNIFSLMVLTLAVGFHTQHQEYLSLACKDLIFSLVFVLQKSWFCNFIITLDLTFVKYINTTLNIVVGGFFSYFVFIMYLIR